MCLNPLKIRNPTKKITLVGGQQVGLEVPCNQCAECINAKRNEWYLRTYYEVQNTFSNGGYVLFDTLTYADEYLPKLSRYVDVKKYALKDFSCFDHNDFRGFLKRLRRRLEYKYHSTDFRYFLTSEYGTKEQFTHRPHYHILFFVRIPISPLEFSRLIGECWTYGRTDGIAYNSVSHVAKHVYGYNLGYGSNKDFTSVSSVCMYVSKYITKSSKFTERLKKRIYILQNKYPDIDALKLLIRNIDMFHRQSQGFGLSYIYNLNDRAIKLLADDKMYIKDKKEIFKTFPLPMYYKRKLYYTQKKRSDDTRYWELTKEGFEHSFIKKMKLVDDMVLNIMDDLSNTTECLSGRFYKYLQSRDISDFVIYLLFYRGRIRCLDSVDYTGLTQNYKLSNYEINLYDWLQHCWLSARCNSLHCGVYSVDDKTQKISVPLSRFVTRDINKDVLHEHVVFNENSCEEFKDYDKMISLLEHIRKTKNIDKQKTFEYTEDYKERLKNINLL